MALAFAILPGVVFRRGRYPFAARAVFSLHLYAFLLLLFCVVTAVEAVNLSRDGVPATAQSLDYALSSGLVAACASYLYFAIGAVYGGSRTGRMLRAIALSAGAAAIVLGYRFVLLVITLYSA